MPQTIIAMAQINTLVGDISGNTRKTIDVTHQAIAEHQADIVLYPELTLIGYPPEDLLLRPSVGRRIQRALDELLQASREMSAAMVVGAPIVEDGVLYNAALVIYQGKVINTYYKQALPNYQVFDEQRYFAAGDEAATFELNGITFGLSICEDIWHPEPTAQSQMVGADILLNLNASPYHRGKPSERQELLQKRAEETGLGIIYTNAVGAQDELVFDGGSMAVGGDQTLCVKAPGYSEALVPVAVEKTDSGIIMHQGEVTEPMAPLACVYQALVIGLRDYINKNGFKGALLGLSGGIDSGLTLAIAVDALGPERVMSVMMPFKWTSEMSKEDAGKQAETLGVDYASIAIEPMYDAFMSGLEDQFVGTEKDTTEENLQARCRGVLLMAMSNKKGYLVTTTGNKSENSVGYSTLYGDMAGGFNVLKDVPKTLVYELAQFRNNMARKCGDADAIPQRVIDRPPSAELAPDQVDEDSLPPYDQLDRMLELYIERDYSADEIVADGFDKETVYRITRLVDINEYKRRQAPVGTRITKRGFGRDRRYPITNGWRAGE
ncbi:Glutamine-dependent NAD(+) synthetase [BD1-7 clade bacterium]|uniref:Glutamine-dependent NAD(+) synthetase n=1 Tax=BD1-7 clade bacterium TaxID=2029982 RepID=A0A5S9P4N1_9GAMM|nr:Glutamine-dependent NAD(+) synthetase [BD1-7 clade bacterium]CAA0098373.1 Glutamine-dependent NAD(+) synthetase [BD1-7 clade bacterium]